MPDFDPINLGKYIPRDMLELRDAYQSIRSAFDYMMVKIVGNTTLREFEEKYGSECALVVAELLSSLPSGQALQVQCWEYLRHELVTGDIKACVVDLSGSINRIENSFWITDFAKVAFSSGELPNTPSYPCGGIIVVSIEDHEKLFTKYVRYFIDTYWINKKDDFTKSLDEMNSNISETDGSMPESSDVSLLDVPVVKRRGRPPLFDIEEFLTQAVLLLVDDRNPLSSQNELARRTADAYERIGGPGGRPSIGWARAHTQRIWTALRAANNC